MQISAAMKTQLSRLLNRTSSDRGNIGLTVMIGTVLMMLATYAAVKALAPALHTIAARSDIRRAGTLSNLANSYIAQTGDMQPTIAKLVTAGLLPATSKGVCPACNGVGTYTTNDGSVLSMLPGGSAGIFGMTLAPGPNMTRDMNFYLSHLTGSVQSGSSVAWNQPVPTIANLGTRFVSTNPTNPGATQTVGSPLASTSTISTPGWVSSGATSSGYISSGPINTNGNPINSGSENTGTVNSSTVNTGSVSTMSVRGGNTGNNLLAPGNPNAVGFPTNAGLPGIVVVPASGGVYLGNNGGTGTVNFLSGLFVWAPGVCDGAGGCPLPWGYYPMGLTDGNTWRTGNGYGMNYYVGQYYCGYVYEAPGSPGGFSSGYHFFDTNCFRSQPW